MNNGQFIRWALEVANQEYAGKVVELCKYNTSNS